MTRWTRGTRLLASFACAMVLAAACGSGDTDDVTAIAASSPSATVSPTTVPRTQPQTSTARDVVDGEGPEGRYERFVAQTEPLPADGGELVHCDDVPELESRVEGTLGGRQNIADDVAGVLITYWMEHLDTFGGMWIDRAHGGAIVLAFTDDADAHLEAILARAPSPDDYPAVTPRQPIADARPLGERDDVAIDVLEVRFTEAELRSTQNAVGQHMGPEFGLLSAGSGTTKNRVELGFVDPPEGALDAIAELVPTAAVCFTVTRTPKPPTGPLKVIPDITVDDPLVSCAGTPPVPYSNLVAPPSIDDVTHPAVDALRAELAAPGPEPLPEADWVVISIGDTIAVFAALGEDLFGTASFERNGDNWILGGFSYGGDCEPIVVLPEGLGRVEVRLDPGSLPEAEDRVIDLLVTEVACAGGREMGDALLAPQVVETADAVLVAFAVLPVVGAATCQGNPSTSVSIELAEPLGDRALLDGLRVPPQPLTDEPF